MSALVEAAAARENGQDERLVVEKERAHKKREAEIERKHQRERAEHERELSILAAHSKVLASNEAKFEVSEIPKKRANLGQKSGFELTLRFKIRLKKQR